MVYKGVLCIVLNVQFLCIVQMPIFDAGFFEWYIRYVISPSDEITQVLCNNWGIEALWCIAALDYAKTSIGYA